MRTSVCANDSKQARVAIATCELHLLTFIGSDMEESLFSRVR